jgi:hypothetical protein
MASVCVFSGHSPDSLPELGLDDKSPLRGTLVNNLIKFGSIVAHCFETDRRIRREANTREANRPTSVFGARPSPHRGGSSAYPRADVRCESNESLVWGICCRLFDRPPRSAKGRMQAPVDDRGSGLVPRQVADLGRCFAIGSIGWIPVFCRRGRERAANRSAPETPPAARDQLK